MASFRLKAIIWNFFMGDFQHWVENRMFPYSPSRGLSRPTPAQRVPQVLPGRQEV